MDVGDALDVAKPREGESVQNTFPISEDNAKPEEEMIDANLVHDDAFEEIEKPMHEVSEKYARWITA